MRILKVKKMEDKSGVARVLITYEELGRTGQWDEYQIMSADKPAPSFDIALAALSQHALDMIEVDSTYLNRLTVRGVSFSYTENSKGGDDIVGATMICRWRLDESNTDLNLNTPHKFSSFTSGGDVGDERQLLSRDCLGALDTLQYEAEQFIKGNRAQLSLFDKDAA